MNKKLFLRILGAISSSLIIVSVFLPFKNVVGYSQSLWQIHQVSGTLYLPIMIIIFGFIGVIFFSLNIKTEFAYSTAGALLFFLIMQIVPAINEGSFNTFGMGFYCLAIGTIFTVIMAFLCNLRTKIKVSDQIIVDDLKNESVLNQIDRLYDNQNNNMSINMNNDMQLVQNQEFLFNDSKEIIQPLNVSNVSVEQNTVNEPIQFEEQQMIQSVSAENSSNESQVQPLGYQSVEQIMQSNSFETETYESQVQPLGYQGVEQMMQSNSFETETYENQVQPLSYETIEQQSNINVANYMPEINPVIREFNTQNVIQPLINDHEETLINNEIPIQEIQISGHIQNPDVPQFDNVPGNTSEPILRQFESKIQSDVQNEQTNINNLDIFR